MSRRMSSAYGTHDDGNIESTPVVGGEYGAGGGSSVVVAIAVAALDTTAVVWILESAGGPDIRTVDALMGTPEPFQLEWSVERLT